jgi:proteasome lid subunit RPN8/RPN11
MLVWPKEQWEALKGWSAKCYPYEGCALLVGEFAAGHKRLRRFVPIPNLLQDKSRASSSAVLETASATLGRRVDSQGQFEFVMDPSEFNRAALAAEKEGLDVVGVLHTHPDHPARPSATDSAQPLLAVWSNVIVKVDGGRFVEARSWVRDEEADPFREEPISVE